MFEAVYCRILGSSYNRQSYNQSFRISYIRIIGILYRIKALITIFRLFLYRKVIIASKLQ